MMEVEERDSVRPGLWSLNGPDSEGADKKSTRPRSHPPVAIEMGWYSVVDNTQRWHRCT